MARKSVAWVCTDCNQLVFDQASGCSRCKVQLASVRASARLYASAPCPSLTHQLLLSVIYASLPVAPFSANTVSESCSNKLDFWCMLASDQVPGKASDTVSFRTALDKELGTVRAFPSHTALERKLELQLVSPLDWESDKELEPESEEELEPVSEGESVEKSDAESDEELDE